MVFNYEVDYQQYICKLEKMLGHKVNDHESTGVRKPSKGIFVNARRLISILCNLDPDLVCSFCITPEGLFQVMVDVYTQNKGTITVELKGFRCYNKLTQTMKFISSSYTDEQILGQIKKYMKYYL